jgi:hypothetical protein
MSVALFGGAGGAHAADTPTPTTTPAVPSGSATPSTPAASTGSGLPSAGFGLQLATDGKPDARPSLAYTANPGARLQDQVAIANFGPTPLVLDLYATDAYLDSHGNYTVLSGEQAPTQVGSWVNFSSPRQITIPARTASGPTYKIVKFLLSVPVNAEPGDHAGGIVLAMDAKAPANKGVNINLDQRVALRLRVRVTGAMHPGLQIQNLQMTYTGPAAVGNPFSTGYATLHYRVTNTGNVRLAAHQTIKVGPWIGSKATLSSTPQPAHGALCDLNNPTGTKTFCDIPILLPGSSVEVAQRVNGVFPGIKLKAEVTLFPQVPVGDVDTNVHPVTQSVSVWGWRIEHLVIILLLLMLPFVVWYVRRRQQKARLNGKGPKHGHQKASRDKKPKASVAESSASGPDEDGPSSVLNLFEE